MTPELLAGLIHNGFFLDQALAIHPY